MGAVLDIVRRPEGFSRSVVALVEQRVERLQHELFVFLLDRFLRMILLFIDVVEMKVEDQLETAWPGTGSIESKR